MLIDPTHVKVEVSATGCWLWAGHTNDNGYSLVRRAGRQLSAHRWNWEQSNGPIPKNLEVNHKCRVRNCINPEHLELLTHAENIRFSADLKTTCAQGHPYDKVEIDRGYRSRSCSICQKEYDRKYREANRERINKNSRESARRKRNERRNAG